MLVVLLYTDIADLFRVQTFVKDVVNWKDLGLALGLLHPTLQTIEGDYKKKNDCMREMLAKWLQRQDNVSRPSWSVLQTALKSIGENELANKTL